MRVMALVLFSGSEYELFAGGRGLEGWLAGEQASEVIKMQVSARCSFMLAK